MSGHYLRKRARGADWSFRFVAFSGVFLIVSLIFFRLGGLDFQGFSWAVLLTGSLAALGLLLAVLGLSDAWRRGSFGGGRSLSALAVGLLVASPFAVAVALAIEHPSGNVAETVGFAPALPPTSPAPGAPSARQPTQGLLAGRDYRATAAEVYGAAQSVIENSGWTIVSVETAPAAESESGDLGVSGTVTTPVPTLRDSVDFTQAYDGYAALDSEEYLVTALAEMPILAFPSDVTIRIVEENGVTFVDMRSQSRTLNRDLGQNGRFIDSFFGRLDSAMELLQNVVVED